MNWAWWDGKMPVEQYRHEHELNAEALGGAQESPVETDKPVE
jgi:hypothetical protein